MTEEMFILTNQHQQFIGVFSSPDAAIAAVYLQQVYQVYRGYNKELHPMVWEHNGGPGWYAYTPEQYAKSHWDRGLPLFEIHLYPVNWGVPCETEVRKYGEETLPSMSDVFRLVPYRFDGQETTS